MIYNNYIKRVIDFILSLVGLILLSPVFIILCLWIKLDSKGPISVSYTHLDGYKRQRVDGKRNPKARKMEKGFLRTNR